MRRHTGDYVEKFANNIEDKLDMSSHEIKNLSSDEFRNILKHQYFRQKRYTEGYYAQEPTDRQMEVLNRYYGIPEAPERMPKREKVKRRKPVMIPFTMQEIPADKNYYYVVKKTNRRRYIEYVRRNISGRWIDSRTGKFVRIKNKK